MSYALRNTLIFVVLLVATVALGGYWVRMRQPARMEALRARETSLKVDLDNVNAVLAIYDTTLSQLEGLKARWIARTQIVPVSDDPAQTLSYLYGLTKQPKASVSFNFQYEGRSDETDYSANQYRLEGEAPFENLYAFLWRLENGRRFCGVDHLEIEAYKDLDAGVQAAREWVKFRVVLQAYFAPQSQVEDLPSARAQPRPESLAGDPFRPLIAQTVPENRLGLFEVTGARLRGLTARLAFLVDRKDQVHLLREGDAVYLGRLARIDMDRNRVEFLLDEGGIWKRRTLQVEVPSPKP